MNIIKELEKLKYELEKKTYGDSLDVWALVEILLKHFEVEKKKVK